MTEVNGSYRGWISRHETRKAKRTIYWADFITFGERDWPIDHMFAEGYASK